MENNNILSFKNTYSTFLCFFGGHLSEFLVACENTIRKEESEKSLGGTVNISLVTVEKVGLFRYLVAWKVEGYFK